MREHDSFDCLVEDDETVFVEAENFNITVLPSTPKAHRGKTGSTHAEQYGYIQEFSGSGRS